MNAHSTPSRIFTPSPQQQAVFDWVKNGQGNAFVEAVAGSGKTTTLIEVLKLTEGSVAFAAYNNAIAKEIQAKVAPLRFGNRVRVGTFHSFGFGAWRYVHKNVQAGPQAARDKADMTARELEIPQQLRGFVEKLVGLAKQRALGLYGSISDMSEWYDIIDHFDLAHEIEDEGLISVGVELAIKALNYHKSIAHQIIDFDDMIYMPVISSIRMWQNDWLLTDECQPAGTLVEIPDGRISKGRLTTKAVPIETLKTGDMVVSFNRNSGTHIMSGRRLTSVRKRDYSGLMHHVSCANKHTSYTSNHWCWADCRNIVDSYFVYVMKRGNRFRIGQCKGRWSGGANRRSGLGFRLLEERADALWVIGRYDDQCDALVAETLASITYGLPMTRFESNNKYKRKHAEKVWGEILNNTTQAEVCLSEHGRDLRYPFMESGQQQERDLTRPRLVRAVNLMDGMQMLPFNGKSRHERRDARPIQVSSSFYKGPVYSLEVDIDEMYVADGITTHNCQDTNGARRAMARKMLSPRGRAIFVGDRFQAVYGFVGADNDAVDRIKNDFNCTQLPLTVTYRCPKSVVSLAQTVVSHIVAADEAPEGIVRTIQAIDIAGQDLQPSDAILCRKTKPLVELAYTLIRKGVACHVEGKDIGVGLLKLVNKYSAKTLDALKDKLEAFRDRECVKLIAKGRETQAENLADRVDTVFVMMDGCKTVRDLANKIASMFMDSEDEPRPTLTLATVHRSKGREWSRVFLLGANVWMPSKYARQQWQLDQEYSLIYVAYTRAKHELVLADVVE